MNSNEKQRNRGAIVRCHRDTCSSNEYRIDRYDVINQYDSCMNIVPRWRCPNCKRYNDLPEELFGS